QRYFGNIAQEIRRDGMARKGGAVGLQGAFIFSPAIVKIEYGARQAFSRQASQVIDGIRGAQRACAERFHLPPIRGKNSLFARIERGKLYLWKVFPRAYQALARRRPGKKDRGASA